MRPWLALIAFSLVPLANVHAQSDARSSELERRLSHMEKEIDGLASVGLVMFLFGAFCAL